MSIYTWQDFLKEEKGKEYYARELKPFIEEEYRTHRIFPGRKLIYRAMELTPLDRVRVVILGQDPYHEEGQAMGLAFSVPDGIPLPPSLVNIYTEIAREYPGFDVNRSGNLEQWAKQGVLLLNTVLTVREHAANSHAGKGWERFTDGVIRAVAERDVPVVMMLWGRAAQTKAENVIPAQSENILVLKTSHPSPLSVYRGFAGCGHFRKCNDFLQKKGLEKIVW